MKTFALIASLLPLTASAAHPLASVPLKAASFTCSPKRVHAGEVLTVRMSVPHPQELAVLTPDGSYLYLWPASRSTEELIRFVHTSTLSLGTDTARDSRGDPLFIKAGWYTFQLSRNLERENSSQTMNECRVFFFGRPQASGARPNNSFKPSPLRGLGQNPPFSGGPA